MKSRILWKKRALLIGLAVLLLALTSCKASPSLEPPPLETLEPPVTATPTTPTPTPAPTPTLAPTPAPLPDTLNPLTGEPLSEGATVQDRPTAVMLNNLQKALPMSGVGQADVIYETLAEGGITRMLGVYHNPDDLEKIGTVRSARTYYLELALGHDAIFVHAGGSYLVYDEIKAWGIQTLDYVNGHSYASLLGWRDEARRSSVGSEHSVYTSGGHILKAIDKINLRTQLSDRFVQGWSFAQDSVPAGDSAAKIDVPFTKKKSTIFTYDAEKGVYFVEEYGKAFMDEAMGEQVSVTNVITVNTSIDPIPGDKEGRLKTVLTGTGSGSWSAGGKTVPILWEKKAKDDPFVFKAADGTPVTLAVGRSYICVVGLDVSPVFS